MIVTLPSLPPKVSQAIRPRSRPLMILSVLLLISVPLLYHASAVFTQLRNTPSHHRYNAVLGNTPQWTHPLVHKVMYNPAGLLGPPSIIPGLRNAPWAGSWGAPKLSRPVYQVRPATKGGLRSQLASPALLMLHIFSTPSAGSRRRRHLIRETGLIKAVPEKFRHLVEIKFVLGLQKADKGGQGWDQAVQEEQEIAKEVQVYGDIIRLKELEGHENMNNGKTWEWARYVGREGGREAWWVIKCDDDTLPLLPNLLSYLLSQDPSKPTYLGSALGRWTGYHYYFGGMMYGFSWGVVKTLAVADVPISTRNYQWDEDSRMGELMFSLPLAPTSNLEDCSPPDVPAVRWSLPPPSPDPCTALVRLDLQGRIGTWRNWMTQVNGAVAWHELKNDEDYKSAYEQAVEGFESRGEEYVWDVQDIFRPVADA